MLPDALIGYTGFVGSSINSGWKFGALYRSNNINEICGRQFGTVVCAGVSAVKWVANKEPAQDWEAIQRLKNHLETIQATRFVLISSVDVYPTPAGVAEDDFPDLNASQPYGRHRLMLERWVAQRFTEHFIVRLPALFGPGLKKNIIFDLIKRHMTANINPNSTYQWYPIRRITDDLRTIIRNNMRLINIAVEPVPTLDIVSRFFPGVPIGAVDMPPISYDVRTRYANLLGSEGLYHISSTQVIDELAAYLAGPTP